MSAPLVIELYCGTFGWSAGWLARGGHAVGFDLEHQPWHGPVPDGAELVLQDVRTLHGQQFKDADLILASPPCQEFSWRAMPWTRAKQAPPPELGIELFQACFRIQREASEAAGRHIPMVVENVCGAQKWVGRARWHFGSYYLWGDVPALMPMTGRAPTKNGGGSWFPHGNGATLTNNNGRDETAARIANDGAKVGGFTWSDYGKSDYVPQAFNTHAERQFKNTGGSWFNVAHNTTSGKGRNPDGRSKGEFGWHKDSPLRSNSSKSNARRAASALIARIPDRLSDWIAECYWPTDADRAA